MTLTAGKLRGLQAVSSAEGIIAAMAIDQRGSLQKALGGTTGEPASQLFEPHDERPCQSPHRIGLVAGLPCRQSYFAPSLY